MKIAVFSTNQYDEDFLSQYNTGHQITFFKVSLSEESAVLAAEFEAI